MDFFCQLGSCNHKHNTYTTVRYHFYCQIYTCIYKYAHIHINVWSRVHFTYQIELLFIIAMSQIDQKTNRKISSSREPVTLLAVGK